MVRIVNSHKALWLFLLLLCINLTSCLGNRDWSYPPQPPGTYLGVIAQRPLPSQLTVLPLKDLRGQEVQSEYWRASIPLVPSGTTAYERPEIAVEPEPVDVLTFDPTHDFAQALADEIREAAVFSSVIFGGREDTSPTDFVLQGTLHSTRWERNITTYGLGPFGTVLWMVGLPMGNTETTLEMDLELTSAKNPSKILWSFTMDVKWWQWDSPYYGLENAVQSYPLALQEALRPAVTDLVEKAATGAKFLMLEP